MEKESQSDSIKDEVEVEENVQWLYYKWNVYTYNSRHFI
jgi:hypothetical protein